MTDTAGPDGVAAPASLVEEAQAAEKLGRRVEARELYERALRALHPPDAASTASSLLRWIGRTYLVDASHDAALDCIEAALAVAELAGDEGAAGHAVNLRANVRWQQGDLDEAEREYLAARESALRAGDARLAAMTAQNLGVIASIRGDLTRAQKFYQTSLDDYRNLGLPKDVCVALNNLGMLCTEMRRFEDAEHAYREALQISMMSGDESARILLHVNLAEMWVARGDFGNAQQACDQALEVSERTSDTHAIGEINKILGVVAREQSSFALAERHFVAADAAALERRDLLLQAQIARELAELFRRQGRNRDTLQQLNRAYKLFAALRAERDIADINRRNEALEGDFLDVVRRWGEAVESTDRYTQGHCERVADIACALAERAGFDSRALFWFRIGALLHDVGKIDIPSEVLNKPGRLDESEWAIVRRHPVAGVEMLSGIDFPGDVLPVVRSHHECWDGSGYPDALAGDSIPLAARILCIADVYDALTSERSYKKALDHEEALVIMRRDVGRQFDPALFRYFEELLATGPGIAHLLAPRSGAPSLADLRSSHEAGAIDELTGLPLRRAFVQRAASLVAERTGEGAAVSLLVIDVDHFKLVNDTFGHLQGDDVLRLVADVLRRGVRGHDFVGRYAGDEFVVLLPGTDLEGAREIADRLRAAVERQRCAVRGSEGEMITSTLSIGAATAPLHGDSVEALFAAADRALYEAKRRGRNTVALAGDGGAEAPRQQLRVDRFVGRVAEQRRLVQHLEASTRGEPRVVAVVGEAGIGKTTLLRHLAPEVRLRAGALIVGRCFEADVKPPYGPWADVIGAIHELGIVPARPWRELPRLVPALADGGAPPLASSAAGSRYALFDELVDYLRAAAAARPLAIVLDDMQWGDSASWDALEHLVGQLGNDRLLVCLTIRAEDAQGITERKRRLSRDERFHEIALQRLSIEDLQSWIEAVFHQADLGTELTAFLHRHTEGNPLLVVQVLRTLFEDGVIWYGGKRWEWRPVSEVRLPVAVSDLIARRIERMSPEARTLLAAAAVVGRTFDVDLVLEAGGGSEDDLLDAIDEAIANDVLDAAGARDGERYSFTHGLLADALRRSVNPRRLRRLHERVARAMETRAPDALAEIASHYDAAGDSPKAYEFAMRAAARATTVYAHDEAASLLSMAQRHASSPEERFEALVRAAQVAESAGRYADGEALCDQVIDSLGPDHRREALPILRLRERLRSLLGKPPQQTLRDCEELLAEARSVGADGERAALLRMLSVAYGALGDAVNAEALARESVAVAARTDDRRQHADSLTRLGTALIEREPREALARFGEALVLFAQASDRHGQVRCQINAGIAYARIGNEGAAERAYASALTLGRTAHAPDLAGLASLNLGVLHMKGGRFDQARDRFEEARQLFSQVRNERHRLAALYNLAHLARERGDADAARDLYDSAARLAGELGLPDVELGALAGIGLAALALGESDAARRWSDAADALLTGREEWWFQGRELVEALGARVAIVRGDAAAAADRFHRGLRRAESGDVYGAAWLVADCAAPLAAAGYGEVWSLANEYESKVHQLGFVPLSRRYAELRLEGRRPVPV